MGLGGDPFAGEARVEAGGDGRGRGVRVLLAEHEHGGGGTDVHQLLDRREVRVARSPLVGLEPLHHPDAGDVQLHRGEPPVGGVPQGDHGAPDSHPEPARHAAVEQDAALAGLEVASFAQPDRGVDRGAGGGIDPDQDALEGGIPRREQRAHHEPAQPRGQPRLPGEHAGDEPAGIGDHAVVVLRHDERDVAALVRRRVLRVDLHVTERAVLRRHHHRPLHGPRPRPAEDHEPDAEHERAHGEGGAPRVAEQVAQGEDEHERHLGNVH